MATSSIILAYAIYVLLKSLVLPSKQFFVLILTLIIIGTVSGTYAVVVLYRAYYTIAELPVLS